MSSYQRFYDYVILNDYNIIGVTETWLNENIPDQLIQLPGYSVFRKDRSSRGGGLCIYIKTEMNAKKVQFEQADTGWEHIWISFKLNNYDFICGTLYRPPRNNILIADLEDCLAAVFPKSDKIIVLGDININLINKTSTECKTFNGLLEQFNLKQIVNEPTRITDTTQSLIDVICINKDITVNNCDIVDLDISDHFLVTCELNIEISKAPPKFIKIRKLSDIDLNSFALDAIKMRWHDIYLLDNINEKISHLNSKILALIDFYAPEKNILISKPKSFFISPAIKKMIRCKKEALRKYQKSRTTSNWENYKAIRNYTSQAIKQEKKSIITNRLNDNMCDSRKLWSQIRNFNIHSKSMIEIPPNLRDANEINNFFNKEVPNVKCDQNLIDFYSRNNVLNLDNFFELHPTNQDEIIKIVKQIKTNATGVDGINIKLLNLVLPYCIDALTHIINYSIITKEVPQTWKQSIITPLPKTNNPSELSHLRPISILPTMSKILERIVFDQMMNHINKYVMPQTQSGFRRNHSTTTALLKIIADLAFEIDMGKVVMLNLLDFSKAFDSINHQLLLAKLHYYGFNVNTIKWFFSYLTDRTQAVKVGDTISMALPISEGVPQGSILGPVLFAVFCADIHDLPLECTLHQYADDTQIYKSSNILDINNCIQSVNRDLQEINSWSSRNGLLLNPNKSLAMCLGTKVKCEKAINDMNMPISIGSDNISIINKCVNLGLTIDQNLTFKDHVNKLLAKSYIKFKSIYSFKYLLPNNVKWKLCQSLILCNFNYCCSVYYPFLTNEYKAKIQKLQNCCLRYAYDIGYMEHLTVHYCNKGILKMDDVISCHYLGTLFNLIKNGEPDYLTSYLSKRSEHHNLNLRNKDLFNVPKQNTEIFKNSFACRAPNLLNEYYNIFFCDYFQTTQTFKKKIKSLFLSRALQ